MQVIEKTEKSFIMRLGSNEYRIHGKYYKNGDSLHMFIELCDKIDVIIKRHMPYIDSISFSIDKRESCYEATLEVNSGIGHKLINRVGELFVKYGLIDQPKGYGDGGVYIFDACDGWNGLFQYLLIIKRYTDYHDYLRSSQWISLRNEALSLAGYKCSRCGVTQNLHIHHLNYKNLGNESQSDLFVACESCHNKFHNK